jgi:altronate dehydratase
MTGEASVARDVRVVSLGETDNVVVAVRPLSARETVTLPTGGSITLLEDIPFGHKLAIAAIPEGGPVVKYDETIGCATSAIEVGAHVHVHNVASARLPGRAASGGPPS